jgi:hypothetical protein
MDDQHLGGVSFPFPFLFLLMLCAPCGIAIIFRSLFGMAFLAFDYQPRGYAVGI